MAQSPAQKLASRRNWYILQCKGAQAQLNGILNTDLAKYDSVFRSSLRKAIEELSIHTVQAQRQWAKYKTTYADNSYGNE